MRRGRHGRGGLRNQQPRDSGDGWEQWGGYMAAKRAKLDNQFNKSSLPGGLSTDRSPASSSASASTGTNAEPQIFRGVSVYINGYTNPPEPELRALFTKHGGKYTSYLAANTTFVIASNLPMGKKKLLAAKTLRASWIVDSAAAGKKLDHRDYMLYNLNAENKQATLSQHFAKSKTETTIPAAAGAGTSDVSGELNSSQSSQEIFSGSDNEEEVKRSKTVVQRHQRLSSHTVTPSATVPQSSMSKVSKDPVVKHPSLETVPIPTTKEVTVVPATEDFFNSEENDSGNEKDSSGTGASTSTNSFFGTKLKTAGEDGFLEDFYNNSRLHLISTMRKELLLMVSEWRKSSSAHKFPFAEAYAESLPLNRDRMEDTNGRVLFHVDLDCFFVAVGRLSRPQLRNKPVAVTHSKGSSKTDSRSDVSCASYEARAKGVKAGMWLHQAKELCPEIIAIPYEFEEYKRVSKIFYETVAGLTLEMEPISIDEMVVDVTEILRTTASCPTTLAAFLINAIKDEAKITASIGIGSNKLTAKLGTRVAKDRNLGHYYMRDSEMREFIRGQPVKSLHGVGYATADKLATEFNVHTGSELEALNLEELKRTFGAKIGEKLHSICRGIDTSTVNCESLNAKSLSAGCSWGVRFTKYQELEKFIRNLAAEINQRALKSKCYGSKLSLTLWVAKKGCNAPIKPGGHGDADMSTKTRKFLQHTREPSIIASAALELSRSIMQTTIPPDRIRGVGISLDCLKYETDISEKEKKAVQTTLFSARRQSSRLMDRRDSSLNPSSSSTVGHSSTSDVKKSKKANYDGDSVISKPETGNEVGSVEIESERPISESPDLEVIEHTDEVEIDIFTGAVLPPTPTKDLETPGKGQGHLTPPELPKENNSEKDVEILSEESNEHNPSTSRTTTAPDIKSKKTETQNSKKMGNKSKSKAKKKPNQAKPKVNPILHMYDRKEKGNVNVHLEGVRDSIPVNDLDLSLSEYDPVVQQRILDSFKKTIKLPYLNRVSKISDVQNIIIQGTIGRMPGGSDIQSLESYFTELISGPHPFLKESCEMMAFLDKLQLRLDNDKENESQAWAQLFEKIRTKMNAAVVARFGGSFPTLLAQ